MSNLGIGVMLQYLAGNKSTVEAHNAGKGKVIKSLTLDKDKDELVMLFDDGTGLVFWDNGQSCCESRYMTCDDDLASYAGATFIEAELAEAPSVDLEWGEHEVQFLNIKTSLGVATLETHNEHNGYYGGFAVCIREC